MADETGLLGGGLWLIAAAAEAEAGAVRARLAGREGREVLRTGVGKANAAAAVAWALARGEYAGVVSLGIAGSLDDGVAVGDVVVASASVFADEGAERPGGWETAADFGFPLVESGGVANGMGVGCDAGLVERVRGGLGGVCGVVHAGVIATVSVCSGTDGRRALTRERSGAVAEAMEGAAVGVASRLGAGVGFLEVRVISNRTGDEGAWDMAGAMAVLGEVAGRL